jgi:uracil-DNA glycosylase
MLAANPHIPLSDAPRTLGHPAERDARLAMADLPHVAPLNALVAAMRDERSLGAEIPLFDPLDGGIEAECLFVLEAPGPGAVDSGFVSRNNPDPSASNFFRFNVAAGLARTNTVTWNIVPWYIGRGTDTTSGIRPARSADIAEGWPYLTRVVALLPKLRTIVLTGKKAQRTRRRLADQWPALTILDCPHPSQQFVNRSPGNTGRLIASLEVVARSLKRR